MLTAHGSAMEHSQTALGDAASVREKLPEVRTGRSYGLQVKASDTEM